MSTARLLLVHVIEFQVTLWPDMNSIPRSKQSRFLFPLCFLQCVDPKYFAKRKLELIEVNSAFRELTERIFEYSLEHGLMGEEEYYNHFFKRYGEKYNPYEEHGCDDEAINNNVFSPTHQNDKFLDEYERVHYKKSATVVMKAKYLFDLRKGKMDYFTFAVIAAVLSHLGNQKKVGGKRKWHVITYQSIKIRMLGFTQQDQIARAALSRIKISEGRIKRLLKKFDTLLFYRAYDGRKYWYTSRTNYSSRDEYINHFVRVRAQKKVDKKYSARQDVLRAALIYRQEEQRRLNELSAMEEILQLNPNTMNGIQGGSMRITEQNNLARLQPFIPKNEIFNAIEMNYGVRLYDAKTIEAHGQSRHCEFRFGKERIYSIVDLSEDIKKTIQSRLDQGNLPTSELQQLKREKKGPDACRSRLLN